MFIDWFRGRAWLFGLITLGLMGLITSAYSESVILAWDPTPGSTIAGYRLYEGTIPNVYPTMLDLGNSTTVTVSNLVGGVTYYFAVTAYDDTGLESPLSAPISYAVPLPRPTLGLNVAANQPVLTCSAPAGYIFNVQASTDLTNWTVIGTATATAVGSVQFADPAGTTNNACFYRLNQVFP